MPDAAPHGTIFDVQRFCTHDGPGIRTVFFLKGCPLRCAWCHNPESQRFVPEILHAPELCIGCAACDAVCPHGSARRTLTAPGLRRRCGPCARCAEVCPTRAIERAGRPITLRDALAEAENDRVFFEESGGGITLSGGEPMAQPRFTIPLLRQLRQAGLHTCVETCGAGPAATFLEAAPFVDLFLWDVKDTDPARHRRFTGADLQPILDNLALVDAAGARTVLRCILVDGVNANRTHLDNIAALRTRLRNCAGVEFLPCHPMGQAKRQRLGMQPQAGPARRPKASFKAHGTPPTDGGRSPATERP